MSKESVVRDAIITAIRAVATSQLGFDAATGNVRDHLLDYVPKERAAAYLAAQVSGKQTAFAVGVQVLGRDEPYAMRNIPRRIYDITVRIYRALGVEGEGVNAAIDAARGVRYAILGMTSTLSDTVDLSKGVGDFDPEVVEGVDGAFGEMVVGTLKYEAEKVNPGF